MWWAHHSSLGLTSTLPPVWNHWFICFIWASNKKKVFWTSLTGFTLIAVSFSPALNIKKGGQNLGTFSSQYYASTPSLHLVNHGYWLLQDLIRGRPEPDSRESLFLCCCQMVEVVRFLKADLFSHGTLLCFLWTYTFISFPLPGISHFVLIFTTPLLEPDTLWYPYNFVLFVYACTTEKESKHNWRENIH